MVVRIHNCWGARLFECLTFSVPFLNTDTECLPGLSSSGSSSRSSSGSRLVKPCSGGLRVMLHIWSKQRHFMLQCDVELLATFSSKLESTLPVLLSMTFLMTGICIISLDFKSSLLFGILSIVALKQYPCQLVPDHFRNNLMKDSILRRGDLSFSVLLVSYVLYSISCAGAPLHSSLLFFSLIPFPCTVHCKML